jgi:hypothetical protein
MQVRTALLLLAILARAESDLPREILNLSRIRAKMRESVDLAPHYTCLETVARSHRPLGKTDFRPVDTLRLEVTRIGHQEFYSWPNARRFEENSGEIVGAGTISTGEYSSHAFDVFANSATQIQFVGEESYRGHVALRYDFRLASFASRWTLTYAGRSGVVASYGSFWADRNTLDVIRLDDYADQIPAALPITSTTSQIDYATVRIGETAVHLPQSAQLRVGVPDGEDRNVIEFSQCRPYATESVIRFDDAGPTIESASRTAPQDITLAPNLTLALQLSQSIDSKTSLEGDTILARVAADVREHRQVIISKGALVRGRVRRLERYSDPVPNFIVGLEFVEIEEGEKHWIFRARLDRVDPIAGLSWMLSTKHGETSLSVETGDPRFPKVQRVVGERFDIADLPGVGTFFVQGEQFRLPQGLNMLWRTVPEK